MFSRRPPTEPSGLLGVVQASGSSVIRPRIGDRSGAFFDFWEVAVFSKAEVLLASLGACRSSGSDGDLSFARAEIIERSGLHKVAMVGMPGISFTADSPEIEVYTEERVRSRPVALAAGAKRFGLDGYYGGVGSAALGPWGTEGRLSSSEAEISWSGKFANFSLDDPWDLIIPQLSYAPRRWMSIASARSPLDLDGEFASEGDASKKTVCSQAPVFFTRRWGSAHPVAWARLIGNYIEKSSGVAPSPGRLFVSGAWVKMGRLGVLGPPSPKTFFALHPSGELADSIGMAENSLLNSPLRALICSSHVKFPKWEARLLGPKLAVTFLTDVSGFEPFQLEVPDPEGVGRFSAYFPFCSSEAIIERKERGRWRHAATLVAEAVLVEFGNREALPYLPYLPKEYALGPRS